MNVKAFSYTEMGLWVSHMINNLRFTELKQNYLAINHFESKRFASAKYQ